MILDVLHEEHLVQGSGPHAILDGVAADLTVQSQGTANAGEREAHPQRDARREAGAQQDDQAEIMPLGRTGITKHECADADLLDDDQFQGAEEFAGLLVNFDDTGTLHGGGVDRQAESGRILQVGVQVEIAVIAFFVFVVQDESDTEILNGDHQRTAEIHLEGAGDSELELAALALHRTGVQTEGIDDQRTELLMVQVID